MIRNVGVMLIGAALLSGCGENTPGPTGTSQKMPAATPVTAAPAAPALARTDGMQEVVATVRGEPLTMQQLVNPLLESHGLTMLEMLVELELVKQDAAKSQAVVTDKDVADERDRQLEKMFADSDDAKLVAALDKAIAKKDADAEAKLRADLKLEREDYLTQLLANKNMDPIEWGLRLKVNTYLRKILEKEWKDKITDEQLHTAFGQMYGEKVKVRYIELSNMTEVTEAIRRLHEGDSFEQVARDMSHDRRTGPNGGELEAFARATPDDRVPAVFKDTAFALKDGQVSDVVAIKSSFMLIKRLHVIPPQHVYFEDTMVNGKLQKGQKENVRRTLNETLIDAGMKGLKAQLAAQMRTELKISNPLLAHQLRETIDRQARAEKKAQEELDRQQHARDGLLPSTTQSAPTDPTRTAPPANGAATQASQAAAGERPPAPLPEKGQALTPSRPDTQPSVVPPANK